MPSAYGSWPSPVTVTMMTSATVGLAAPVLDGPDLYWLESHADQGGRVAVWRRRGSGPPEEVTPAPWNVRTRVHEYGGGEYAVDDGLVVFSSYADGRLYRTDGRSDPVPITPAGDYRYADLRVHRKRDRVLAVREDHRGPGEPVNTLVAIPLSGNTSAGTELCAGADFYASPELSVDGRLAWVEWNHPNMPWDATSLLVGRFDGDRVLDPVPVAGGEQESAVHPRWLANGDLVFVSDRTDWWNLYRFGGTEVGPVHAVPAEFADPQWQLGQSPYGVVDDTDLVCTVRQDGHSRLARLDLTVGQLRPIGPPEAEVSSLAVEGGRVAAVFDFPDRPRELAVLELGDGRYTAVRAASQVRLEPAVVALAEPVNWASPDGPVYGWFYPPRNDSVVPPGEERPPLITVSHGGPTSFSPATFRLSVQYWTSRGIAVLDVNYGGSTGYGRAYRERLRQRWGLVDVADCVAAASALAEQGRVDPQRLAIVGGSAGGYTTLRALTSSSRFTAGISLYGVGDLAALATDTHKFESRYLDGLVGPYPEAAAVYRERSPVYHLDALTAPILLLQGAEDRVVPPAQAEAMAAAARAKGLPVALLVFSGEGHGFRGAETISASLQAQLAFLGRVFGFFPADDLPPLDIENLPD